MNFRQNFRSIIRIDAHRRNASAFWLRHSQSLAKRRHAVGDSRSATVAGNRLCVTQIKRGQVIRSDHVVDGRDFLDVQVVVGNDLAPQ